MSQHLGVDGLEALAFSPLRHLLLFKFYYNAKRYLQLTLLQLKDTCLKARWIGSPQTSLR